MKPVLAFMQNMWLRDPSRFERSYTRMFAGDPVGAEEYRLNVIEYALFAGCVSGRRLKAAFGDLCDGIVWEESTRRVSNNASEIFPAEQKHMHEAIVMHEPKVIITFGKIAGNAMREFFVYMDTPHVACVHPAARGAATVQGLNDAAADVRRLLEVPR